MRTTLRYVEALAAALLAVAAVGACGGDDDGAQSVPAARRPRWSGPTAAVTTTVAGTTATGAPGIPGDNSGGGAPGAPIDIPALQQVGAPIEQVIPRWRSAIRDACDGDLCLVLDDEDARSGENCSYVGTDPPGGTSVERGSTVVVVARCEDGSTSQTSGTDGTETTGTSETETSETETTGNGETGASTEPDTEGTS